MGLQPESCPTGSRDAEQAGGKRINRFPASVVRCALRPAQLHSPTPEEPFPRAFGGRSEGSRVLSLCCSGPERHRRNPDRPGPTRRILERASLLRRLRRDCGSGRYRFNPGWSPRLPKLLQAPSEL